MWVRKSEEEYKHDRRRFWWAVGAPLGFALVLFPIFYFGSIFIGNRPGQVQRPWPEAVIVALFESSMVFIVGYVWQVLFRRKLFERTSWFCDSCHAVKLPDAERECECGGSFEDMDRWKWVKDKGG